MSTVPVYTPQPCIDFLVSLRSLKLDETSTRDFTNDISGHEVVIDKFALEDLVEFQGVTFEVIEGLYWNEGFNSQICASIKDIFEWRAKLKAEGNPAEVGLKLTMNSSYGRLIMKPVIRQKTFIRGEEEIRKYTCRRINRLIQRTPISKDLALFEEHRALARHSSPAHLGVAILSMSKRIMNEVMCLVEDLDCTIYYQDTDSMHVELNSYPKLCEAFEAKYGRVLNGNQMGKFHVDFKLKGADGDIYAEESYFIGKKTYVDFLACAGNDTKGVHMRMKGIPETRADNLLQRALAAEAARDALAAANPDNAELLARATAAETARDAAHAAVDRLAAAVEAQTQEIQTLPQDPTALVNEAANNISDVLDDTLDELLELVDVIFAPPRLAINP
ncbi:unnamed protein product [Phytophthora lilii]|uniref:Unnamed protein product n=1 Tax=Phytophthora lilii TaxID=2077276 RepID=A0A9W6WWZ5_9STRA|nr:unnamed protein product [Phytophthora lilii]